MLTAAQIFAQNNFGDTRTGGLAGPMGLFLLLALGTATVLLIRNMNKRLKRLPAEFPAPEGPGALQAASVAQPPAPAAGPDAAPDGGARG